MYKAIRVLINSMLAPSIINIALIGCSQNIVVQGKNTQNSPTQSATRWVSINDIEIENLKKLIKKDSSVDSFFQEQITFAKQYQQQKPSPIERVRSEGVLRGDPAKEATIISLQDIVKVRRIAMAYAATNDPQLLLAIKNYLLAWAELNKPEGNPINDTKFEELVFSYDLVRIQIPDAQPKIDTWLREMANQLIARRNLGAGRATNNWNSHRLKMVGLIGFAIKDQALIDYAINSYRQQIQDNLHADGSGIDFEERDALHYHVYTLEPLLALAIVADRYGENLYQYESPSGASLPKSIAFLLPYVRGEKTHAEYVNSKVAFDRERAKNNESMFKIGRLFEPVEAIEALDMAAYFDPSLTILRDKISSKISLRIILNQIQATHSHHK